MSTLHLLKRIRRRSSIPLRDEVSQSPCTTPGDCPTDASHPSNRVKRIPTPDSRSSVNDRPTSDNITARQSVPLLLTPNIIEILGATTQLPTPTGSISPAFGREQGIAKSESAGSIFSNPSLDKVFEAVYNLRVVLLVSSINSFTQLVYSKLKERSSETGAVAIKVFSPGTKCTADDGTSGLIAELVEFRTDIIVCPFLTAKIPSELYNKFITLVVHPGPPGDVGPSALDWTLCGDDGTEADPAKAMSSLREGESAVPTRRLWGCIVFQAEEEMDKGPVWAWEEYPLPEEHITKGSLYHFGHSPAAWKAVDKALERVVLTSLEANFDIRKSFTHKDVSIELVTETHTANPERHTFRTEVDTLLSEEAAQPSLLWANQLAPQPEWAQHPVSERDPIIIGFSGGTLANRPLIKPADRKIDWDNWTADKIQQFIAAFDSQPGTSYSPSTSSTKKLFVYGAHCQYDMPPKSVWEHLECENWSDVPNGTAVAIRQGAVFFKTKPLKDHAVGVWITHGRVLKPAGAPIEPKIPLQSALMDGGHGEILARAVEWPLDFTSYQPGRWQETYVHSVPHPSGLIQYVYWSFYNGAFSTAKCRLLQRVIEWATEAGRGKVVALVLMGGHYFSNGIALNTIEHAAKAATSPEEADLLAGRGTWANINAIDDVVELLAGDTHPDRSLFLVGKETLVQKGITTIAVLRGNAAAGGVALAAACDIVMASENAVINPAYRAMGLHGSELHSWSYRERCGDEVAASLLKDMTPMSAEAAAKIGLVDLVLSRSGESSFPPPLGPDYDLERKVLLSISPGVEIQAAPWCLCKAPEDRGIPITIETVTRNKLEYFSNFRGSFTRPPLSFYRNEELSQMLLDCHHPHRSQRYHKRRRAFIRKIKCGKTPSRYAMNNQSLVEDEEHRPEFDDVGEWARGLEWCQFLGEGFPKSMIWSGWTRIVLYPEQTKFSMLSEGYQHDGSLNAFEMVIQRIAMSSSLNASLDYHSLVQEWVDASECSPAAREDIVGKHLPKSALTFDSWVLPQLTQHLEYFGMTPSASLSSTGSGSQMIAPLTPPSSGPASSPQATRTELSVDGMFPHGTESLLFPRADAAPKSSDDPSLAALGMPLVAAPIPTRSFGLPFIMSSAPSTEFIVASSPRLPFSREASPAPTDCREPLGLFVLEQVARSPTVIPPPRESRRWSRLNSGHPDLLSRGSI